MTTTASKKKLGLKERYALMTRGLDWETTYQPMEKVFPYATYEGIKVHDWDAWEDPFRLTMDAYWKYQAEKEQKLYAIMDAFAQNNGHLGLTDARYINALKLFLTGVSPLEYMAHRGFAHVGRALPGVGARVACQMQSLDELRHAQTQIHSMSNYNKLYDGFHSWRHMHDRVWYLSVPKSFFDDAVSAGPFEFLIAIGFSFEYLLTNLLFVPFMSGASFNGDLPTMTFGFSAQSDESRHMTLGLEAIKFLLEQDEANVPIVQHWIDKWFWRGYRVTALIAQMLDYMLPRKVMSWKEAFELYFEEQMLNGLFQDLAFYGIRPPLGVEQASIEKEYLSHQVYWTLYQFSHAAAFTTTVPSDEHMEWLSANYPLFDKHYRPLWEKEKQNRANGGRHFVMGLPELCTVCQIPMLFTEPGDPTTLAQRSTTYEDEHFNFCSDFCLNIFEHEPEKYVQAWLPVHQIYQ
ncbi:MAG TPA: YHS domain-containing protein, partial [Ilumatobacteraceae bacterium]|nr:YHS domain-containing protein [Ilumatobacteraceae bacterium]